MIFSKKETVSPATPFKSGTFKPSQTKTGRDYRVAAETAVLSHKSNVFIAINESLSSSFADVVNPSTSTGSVSDKPAQLNVLSKGISAGGVSVASAVKRSAGPIGLASAVLLTRSEAVPLIVKLSEVLNTPALIPIMTVTAAAGVTGMIFLKIKSFFKRYKERPEYVTSLREDVNNSLDKKFSTLGVAEQKQFLQGYHARMRDDASDKTDTSNFSAASQEGWAFASLLKNVNSGLFDRKVKAKAAQDYLDKVTFTPSEKTVLVRDEEKSQVEEFSQFKEENKTSTGFKTTAVKNTKANVIAGKESIMSSKAVTAGAVTAVSIKTSSSSSSNKGKIMQLTNADSSTVRTVSQAFKKFNEELDEVFNNLRSAVSDASDNWSDERYDEAVSAVDDISGKLSTLTEPSEEAAEAAEKYASKIDEL